MGSFFATTFPDLESAEKAQRLVEKFNDDHVIKLVATVVIAKDQNGAVTKHNGRTPGALGAVMAGLVGGIAGLIAGPAVAALGAASGALSGGWFDLLRVQDRESFMNEVARGIGTNHAALLGEVVNPDEDAKRLVEEALAGLDGVLVRNDE
jgi:uncharacterized membrane protein